MDGWTASISGIISGSPGVVGLQLHNEVLTTLMCVFVSNGLKCTDMCRLHDCENQASSFESDDEESADGDIEELTNEYDF